MNRFRYTPSVLGSMGLMLDGFGLIATLGIYYALHSFTLPSSASALDHLAVAGMLLFIVGFSIFGFTLLLHSTSVRYGNSPASSPSTP